MAADAVSSENPATGTAAGTAELGAVPAPGWSAGLLRVRWPSAAVAGAGLGAVALLLRDPHQPGSWGFCPLYATTGLYCPGCGALRGTAALLHGDLAGAWADNPFWVAAIPVLAVMWVLWLVRCWRGRPASAVLPGAPQWVWWLVMGAFALFGVVRNLPWFPLVPS